MAEPTQGILDTSVVIHHELIDPSLLPDESAIAVVTLAEPASASQIPAVAFAVNLAGTSIGAGFRVVRPKLTFRDLSASIDPHDARGRHRRHHGRMSAAEKARPEKGRHLTP